MRTKILLLATLFVVCCELHSQNFCRRTSVFFESDASDLTESTTRKLDSLASVMKGKEYMVELYGHADSVGNYDYNYRLANQRMRAISNYLRKKTTAKVAFTENNLSETEYKIISRDQEKNLAYNRRVDVFLIPMTNGNVQLVGQKHGVAEAPPALFGPCGICNSTPAVKTFMTREETEKANILLETTEGDSLVTDGMIMLNYNPCAGTPAVTPSITFKMCPGQPDPRMKLWEADTVNGKIVWLPSKDSLLFDYTTGCYVFRGKPGKIYNVDRKWDPGPPPPPDTFCRIIPPLAFAYEHFLARDPKKTVKFKAKKDSVEIGREENILTAHAVGKKGEDYFLFSAPVDSLPYTEHRVSNKIARAYKLPADSFHKLEYTDTLLRIRCGRKAAEGQFGFYLEEYQQFIPFDSTDGKYYYGKAPAVSYQFAYKKGKRLYTLRKGKGKEKYVAEEGTLRIKFKAKHRRKFRSVRNFNEAPK